MSDLWNIFVLTMALTGTLCWVCMIGLIWFYWLCSPERNKHD
jgi:hypothetical protein